ncbi:hypothetical protein SSU05_1675 [Streptococcus suis 05ZYH33]|nr:hypothetical protein SSU05_1675 [Streptococcus suis 05ZYH33]
MRIMLERRSLFGACRDTAKFTWTPSRANSRIFGAKPDVETVMCTGTNCQALVVINHSQEGHNIIVVIKRLTNPHHNDMANTLILIALIQVLLYQHNLSHNLTASQVTLLRNQSRCTECTADITANLCRYTNRKAIVLVHENCLNQHAIWQFKKVFDSTVLRLLYNPLFERINYKMFFQLFNQRFWQVGHFRKRLDTRTVEPFPNLSGTELLLSVF